MAGRLGDTRGRRRGVGAAAEEEEEEAARRQRGGGESFGGKDQVLDLLGQLPPSRQLLKVGLLKFFNN